MERLLRIAGAPGPLKLTASKEARNNVGALLPYVKSFRRPPLRFPIIQAASSTKSERLSPPISQPTKASEKPFYSTAPSLSQVHGVFKTNRGTTILVSAALLCAAVLAVILKSTEKTAGSVEDLVKRGQLRSDRRSNFRPLKYEDPFNNPMVKAGEKNAVVKMYGKAFRLQPVTLTEEKMQSHQSRRVQAYQWKRPTVFLVEGEKIPDGADPDTVRWIPPNHPFATARNDFDEAAAERNVYQTRGVPSRVRAEHEALRRRMMEAAEKETEVHFPVLDPSAKGDKRIFERSFPALSEQPDSGLGSRPIKPYENLDGEFSSKVQD